MAVFIIALLTSALLPGASAHGYIYQPISLQYLTNLLKVDWQAGMPESRRWEPGNARLAPGQHPLNAGDSCGIGYAGDVSDPIYAEGLPTWQKWFEGADIAVPKLAPGGEVEVRADLVADHGGQAWLQVACSDTISEDVDWILLERAPSDRGHHFMPSNPAIYAWAFGDVKALDGKKAVTTSRWLVPATFSCPTGRAVGRWIWKNANTCSDTDNVGIDTETFSMEEYRQVVSSFRQGQNVQGRCADVTGESPEQFLSCFVFAVESSVAPPSSLPVPAPMPPTPAATAPTPAPLPAPVAPAVPATPTPEPGAVQSRCAPIADCGSFPWCDQSAYAAWCSAQMGCPAPFCKSEPESEPESEAESEGESEAESETESSGSQCPNIAYGQCGGIGFSGAGCCPAGHYCKTISDYVSSCYSCESFPDPACSASLLSSDVKLAVSRKHKFLANALIQEEVAIERSVVVGEEEL